MAGISDCQSNWLLPSQISVKALNRCQYGQDAVSRVVETWVRDSNEGFQEISK